MRILIAPIHSSLIQPPIATRGSRTCVFPFASETLEAGARRHSDLFGVFAVSNVLIVEPYFANLRASSR